MKLKVLIAGVLAAATLLTAAGVAGAAPPENTAGDTGWDNVNDAVVGAGSDTSYYISQEVEKLYNQANGCDTNNSSGSATIGQCLVGASQGQTDIKGNWDHDYFVGKYPTGSGAGIREVTGTDGLGAGKTADYARSSSGPASAGGGQGGINFFAYGKEAIVAVTFGNRVPGTLTTAQLTSVFNCSVTDWGTLLTGVANGQTIQPWGINASSGTGRTFASKIGVGTDGTFGGGSCIKKLDTGIFPLENDVKQLNTDPNFVANNAIWAMSFADFKSFADRRQDAQAWAWNGVTPTNATIANDSFPLTRFIYQVTLKADATPDALTDNVLGASGGKGGAVREETEFLCKDTANHAKNIYTGKVNFDELTAIYSKTGFIRVPSAQRTNGVCRVLPGVA